MGTDYTYEERMNRDTTGDMYDTPLDQAVAAEVVAELTSDVDYLEALADKFSLDAEFLAGVQGAVWPVFSAEIVVAAEATEAIAVGIQMKDVAGVDTAQLTNVKVYVTTDLAATPDGLPANITVAATDGAVLAIETADIIYNCLTDSAGLLTLTFTDATAQDITLYIQVVLPTGECINSGAITFAS